MIIIFLFQLPFMFSLHSVSTSAGWGSQHDGLISTFISEESDFTVALFWC
jgi:hypothetical protein